MGAHKGSRTSNEDFYSQNVYKFMQISRYTHLLLAEDNPYGEGEDANYEKELMLAVQEEVARGHDRGDYLDVSHLWQGG